MPTELQQHPPSSTLPEYPVTLLDFQRMFPDEAACLRYLERIRWPNGFCCEKCAALTSPLDCPPMQGSSSVASVITSSQLRATPLCTAARPVFMFGFGQPTW